jgi:CRP-like cAMP-binding protein
VDDDYTSVLTHKLSSRAKLSAREIRILDAVPFQTRDVAADQDLAREGDRPSVCILLVDGFAARYRTLADGRRQILSFQIAGDFMDLQSFTLDRLDHSIGTLTSSRVAIFSHSSISELIAEPSLARLFWHETLVDSAIFREWIVNVGRRNAYQRVAHVLCELVTRMEAVGLARDGICDLPLTQSELADATGLSTVHVNRVIQELRRENLITLRSRTFSALNWTGLKMAAEFDASYLQLGSAGSGLAA